MSDREPTNEKELIIQEIMMLARELGFETTSELEDLERQIKESRIPENEHGLIGEWWIKVERKHPGAGGQVEIKSDIANLLARAKVLLSIGRVEDAREDLRDAIQYAHQAGLGQLADRIRRF
jgi:hypothetical protein